MVEVTYIPKSTELFLFDLSKVNEEIKLDDTYTYMKNYVLCVGPNNKDYIYFSNATYNYAYDRKTKKIYSIDENLYTQNFSVVSFYKYATDDYIIKVGDINMPIIANSYYGSNVWTNGKSIFLNSGFFRTIIYMFYNDKTIIAYYYDKNAEKYVVHSMLIGSSGIVDECTDRVTPLSQDKIIEHGILLLKNYLSNKAEYYNQRFSYYKNLYSIIAGDE